MLPDKLNAEVEAALSHQLEKNTRVRTTRPMGGGCISNASRVTTTEGDSVFLKWCRSGELPAGIFAAEAVALCALREAEAIRVPLVIAQSAKSGEFEWLLLEWLEPARLTRADWRELGHGLANLHRRTNNRFGWVESNFIGSLPQSNEWSGAWPSFWRTQRLQPQLEMASGRSALRSIDRNRFDRLLDALDELIGAGNIDGPSLLHGDLWNGNVIGTRNGNGTGAGTGAGNAAIIDPASYYGHREVDLAMAALFGGFDSAFYEAYDEAWPPRSGWEDRRLVYQLYYLLVHVNLFGGSYVGSTLSAVGQLGF